MITECRPTLAETVNEDYLCLAGHVAEKVIDGRAAYGADHLAAYVMALVAEIRRLDAEAGRRRPVVHAFGYYEYPCYDAAGNVIRLARVYHASRPKPADRPLS